MIGGFYKSVYKKSPAKAELELRFFYTVGAEGEIPLGGAK